MNTVVVFGIPNCDTVKKARAWLAGQGVEYRFHDFRKDGLPEAALARWVAEAGWEALLNRKGTTWRALDDAARASAADAPGAGRLMQAHPTLIKRPVIEWPGRVTVGFDEHAFAELAGR